MKTSTRQARLRAAGTMAFLLVVGAMLGIAVDRIWLMPTPMEANPLTAGAMSERLGLSPEEEAELDSLLDSLHGVIAEAAGEGPEALRAATEAAHRRIAETLPPESRMLFHSWMQEHRNHMMHRMHMGSGRGGGPPSTRSDAPR